MPPDYSAQLSAIVEALKQSQPWYESTWIVAMGSALLGLVGGILGQRLQQWLERRDTRAAMLRILYGYTGQLLSTVDSLIRAQGQPDHLKEVTLRTMVGSSPSNYIAENRAVFIALNNAPSFDAVSNLLASRMEGIPLDAWLVSCAQIVAAQFVPGCPASTISLG